MYARQVSKKKKNVFKVFIYLFFERERERKRERKSGGRSRKRETSRLHAECRACL